MKNKLLLCFLLTIMIFPIMVNAKEGLQVENGKTYYYENDVKVNGFKLIDNKLYFFSRVDYALKKGWQHASEGYWYQKEDGEVVVGRQEVDGNTYYFNENGIMQTGFIREDNKLYFYSRVNGVLKKGWQHASEGYWYQKEDGEVVIGKQEVEGNTYYFNENGIMQNGFITDNNELYFYSRVNGVLKKGWQHASEGAWYQDEDGKVLRGNHNIEDRDYKFNDTTGLVDGFKKENNKTYYYNPDGTQAKGIQYMCGRFYLFNENTGEFEKYASIINVIDVSAHQKDINWSQVKKSGIVDAVILRLGYGQGYMDKYFIQNKKELERLGIPYSVYLFSYAENKEEALKESEFLVKAIKENKVHIYKDFSIFYDLEDWEIKSTGENSYGISKDTYSDMITTFIENTEKNLCIQTRVYASKNYIETRFDPSVQKYATWVAQWNNKLTYKGNYEGWQYTDCLSVPGINGCVDASKFYY